MNLLLICETPIIEHIFSLICKKLKLNLKVQNNCNVSEKYDLIVVDQNLVDNKFNHMKKFSILIGAISSEELPINKLRDFLIPRPFLPSKLESILIEQIKYIKEDLANYSDDDSKINEEEISFQDESDEIVPVINYLENELSQTQEELNLLNDDIDEENLNSFIDSIDESNLYSEDESIVSISSLKSGGVLDSLELNKINNILKENERLEHQDWNDIDSIIDDALINTNNNNTDDEHSSYSLILNKYGIDELRPLLEKFDQTTIDKIAQGETVDLKVSLKGK